jgi:thioredoxin 1/putative thioredoxin
MSALITVTEQNFESEVMTAQVPVLVEFGAEWCGPCKTVLPELTALAQELGAKAKVVQVDIDKSPFLAQTMGIRSVPTFVVFSQGRPVDGRQGAVRKVELRTLLEPFLPRAEGAINAKEAAELAKSGAIVFVDTRGDQVYGRTHIEGAVSFPLETIETRLGELAMLPATPVLYCRSGKDSEALAKKLSEQGFGVAYLEGGVLGWEADGYSLYRP